MDLADVQVERRLTDEELRQWARRAFGLSMNEVAVGKRYDDPTAAELSSRVLVLWDMFKGAFPFRVSTFVRDTSLTPPDEDEAFDDLARQTGARLIVFDDSPEPDHVTVVAPDGSRRGAYIDPDALDEDTYEIERWDSGGPAQNHG